jgi:aminoglycoside 2'-N-acetyltransferase I
MIELRTVHTADLDASTRSAIRRLMDAAFDGVSDDAFENVLGGVHALVVAEGELTGHGSVVSGACCMRAGRCAPVTSKASRSARTGAARGMARR